MSYDIGRSMSFKKDGSVSLSAASSNVYPRNYYNTTITPNLDGESNTQISMLYGMMDGDLKMSHSANEYKWPYINQRIKHLLHCFKANELTDEQENTVLECLSVFQKRASDLNRIKLPVMTEGWGYLRKGITEVTSTINFYNMAEWAESMKGLKAVYSVDNSKRFDVSSYGKISQSTLETLNLKQKALMAIDLNNIGLLKDCLDKGLDINYQDELGNTLLINAVIAGRNKIENHLRELGADTQIKNKMGQTVDYIQLSFLEGVKTLDFPNLVGLIEENGNLMKEDIFGMTPAQYIVKNYSGVDSMIKTLCEQPSVQKAKPDFIDTIVNNVRYFDSETRKEALREVIILSGLESNPNELFQKLKLRDEKGLIEFLTEGEKSLFETMVENGLDTTPIKPNFNSLSSAEMDIFMTAVNLRSEEFFKLVDIAKKHDAIDLLNKDSEGKTLKDYADGLMVGKGKNIELNQRMFEFINNLYEEQELLSSEERLDDVEQLMGLDR